MDHERNHTIKTFKSFLRIIYSIFVGIIYVVIAKLVKRKNAPKIKKMMSGQASAVDSYWGKYVVASKPFISASQSESHLRWRFSLYPLFKEVTQLYGEHDGEIILDYGCGPGNDTVGFAIYTNAKRIIGVDVSEKALERTSQRLALHCVDDNRIELIQISDSVAEIPLESESVDHINCQGVLHHVSNLQGILEEFFRVMKPHADACVMVYNRNSIWFHLYTAYVQMIVEERFPGMDVSQAFSRTVDGANCPIARCYKSEEFILECQRAGFKAEFSGSYLSKIELDAFGKYGDTAQRDERLAFEHREFLNKIKVGEGKGFPKFMGDYAGIGGVYRLCKTDGDEK